jgi:hypothetical protein
MYKSTYSWPKHLMVVSGQLPVPAALHLEKQPPLPIGLEARWAPEQLAEKKNLAPTGARTPAPLPFKPVVSRYTD